MLGVVGVAAGGMITAKAVDTKLPEVTTTRLVADVQNADMPGLSGTIVAQLSLGLPDLPGMSGPDSDSSMLGLLSGSHTLRLWYGGPDRQRLALLGVTSETDLFHSGRDVWEWDSNSHVATHMVLPQHAADRPSPAVPTGAASLTPQQLADQLLAAIDPSTKVSMGPERIIADRSAYELVLTPRAGGSRVGSVDIAIDGATKVPLGVQVYPAGSSTAAIDVAFTSVTFKTPAASYFEFTPPHGATVHQSGSAEKPAAGSRSGHPTATTIGSGWSSIVEYRVTPQELQSAGGSALGALTPVSGSWGHGRLLDSALVSVLVTDDGRVFAGAVDPAALYAAAGH